MSIQTLTLAMTGASGAPYGFRLLELLLEAGVQVRVLISKAAQVVIAKETGHRLGASAADQQQALCKLFHVQGERLQVYGREQWMAPVASGSNASDAMVICPCSMGTLSAVACGASNNLIERAADVSIKERRPLILVPRETPFSAIHLQNMLTLANLGVTILPAVPGFYHQPQSVQDLVDFVVARILDHLQLEHRLCPRWGEEEKS